MIGEDLIAIAKLVWSVLLISFAITIPLSAVLCFLMLRMDTKYRKREKEVDEFIRKHYHL